MPDNVLKGKRIRLTDKGRQAAQQILEEMPSQQLEKLASEGNNAARAVLTARKLH